MLPLKNVPSSSSADKKKNILKTSQSMKNSCYDPRRNGSSGRRQINKNIIKIGETRIRLVTGDKTKNIYIYENLIGADSG